MHEEIRYRVCPHRNVPAAFERFLGPDSGGIERFFPEQRGYRLDDTIWEVRMKGRRTAEAVTQKLHGSARVLQDGCLLAAAALGLAGDLVLARARACSASMVDRIAGAFNRWRPVTGLPL
jgi:hypothetical protein